MSGSRTYHSPSRQQQADETRRKIADAARKLMVEKGFDGTTIEAVAREAGVSAPTVYAVFGSKRGLLAELMERARFGPDYADVVKRAKDTTDPAARLRSIASIVRRIYEAERAEMEVLRGAAAVSPELAARERERECQRYDSQARSVEVVASSGRLRSEFTLDSARDSVWALTGRETFRALALERGWSVARYETWLGDVLVRTLLTDDESAKPAPAKASAKTASATTPATKPARRRRSP